MFATANALLAFIAFIMLSSYYASLSLSSSKSRICARTYHVSHLATIINSFVNVKLNYIKKVIF
jgi:hypothetical protein